MADIEYSDAGFGGYEPQDTAPERARGARLGAVVNWAGALMSLGLIVGMGIWAVQLLMRDVSGVPVIAAIEGPMRQPPADPGGTQAPHQGLAVNRIAEGEEAQPVPDRLVLAPPPIELQEVRFETAAPAEVTPVPRQEIAAESPGDVPQDASETDTAALIDRLLQEAQTGVVPEAEISVPEDTPVIDLAIASEAVEGVLPASVPGIARSLRPAARPAAFVPRAPIASSSSSGPTVEEIAVTDLPDGTRLVQLGAFDTAEIAREAWNDIAGRFPEYFDDRPRVIEAAESGGQTFYRLRAAGFDDLAGSRRFCAVLVAQGTACIPVTVR
jgi:hypothetical protein